MFKKLLTISLVLAATGAWADTAEDYFHRGAQFYIFGDKQKATTEVMTGIQKFPDDSELRKLAVLLKKEEKQNPQDQKNDQKQDNKQDQDKSQNQQQNKQNQNQNQDQDNKQQQQQPDKQNQKQNQPQQPSKSPQDQDQNKKDQEKADEQRAYAAAGQMTPEQAQQLLDSEKNQELLLPVSRNTQTSAPERPPLHDW